MARVNKDEPMVLRPFLILFRRLLIMVEVVSGLGASLCFLVGAGFLLIRVHYWLSHRRWTPRLVGEYLPKEWLRTTADWPAWLGRTSRWAFHQDVSLMLITLGLILLFVLIGLRAAFPTQTKHL